MTVVLYAEFYFEALSTQLYCNYKGNKNPALRNAIPVSCVTPEDILHDTK